VRKAETLRGRGAFQLLYRSGRRIDGEVLRCFFRWETGAGTQVRAGFSVSAKKYNAVKRNRAKRLMRTAFDLERATLAGAAERAGRGLSLLFVYTGTRVPVPGRFTLDPICIDLGSLCRKVCAAAGRE
jgi:ribonuclease P protein component